MTTYNATYSPEDNKLRLRASARLDKELYARLKAAGFSWAPRQELFVAPMWTPQREDILLELCDEIEDEDTSLVERAEARADRFENYSARRESDAHAAKNAVARIADGIPLGQPILVGHHSERHARRDAQRIENGMRKAVKMWETSIYWERRAAGAIAAAKYKELPRVRASRIARLEAEERKHQRSLAATKKLLEAWSVDGLTQERAADLAGQPFHAYGLWSKIRDGQLTAEQARDIVLPQLTKGVEHHDRWLAHLKNRLIYERCMLEESGWVAPVKQKSAKQTLPLCNYRADTIKSPSRYHRGQIDEFPQIEMTKAQYARIYKDYKGTRIVDNSHKVRIALVNGGKYSAVFITDSKVHAKPEPIRPPEPRLPEPRLPDPFCACGRRQSECDGSRRACTPREGREDFDALKKSLKTGVQAVSAPQLFPTPSDVAARMVAISGLKTGDKLLEPSAGTGALLRAVRDAGIAAIMTIVELHGRLVERLRLDFDGVRHGDFLALAAGTAGAPLDGPFDVVLMNPPFANGQDIAHILAARALLKSGGRVVAICANGPRQREKLEPFAALWEELPDGTFSDQGTGVRTVLAVFEAA